MNKSFYSGMCNSLRVSVCLCACVCVRPSVPVSVPPPRGASFVRPSRGLPRAWFPTEPKRRGRFLRPQTPTSRREYGPRPQKLSLADMATEENRSDPQPPPRGRKKPPLAPRQVSPRAGGHILPGRRGTSDRRPAPAAPGV